ncbi:MBL fold metallo-hydrolase [Streptomyces viridosporus]|uniref:MBL fold metallo-hydrolase n=1 Tax=Streptomyces viridosporus TaxID=67581 RepID=UPI0036F9C2AE
MTLSINVFNSGYKQIPNPSGWPARQQTTWPVSTSTLIAGDRGALLVDALLITTEGERLAGWVKSWGKNLSTIYITHGHDDHFFGTRRVIVPGFDAVPVRHIDQAEPGLRVQSAVQPGIPESGGGVDEPDALPPACDGLVDPVLGQFPRVDQGDFVISHRTIVKPQPHFRSRCSGRARRLATRLLPGPVCAWWGCFATGQPITQSLIADDH